jgi:hypothetical protein
MERIEKISSTALARVRTTDLGPTEALIGPLADGLVKFDHQRTRLIEELTLVNEGAAGMTRFLTGPSNYLLLAANSGEMRAGSGMLLSAGQLDVAAGSLEVGQMSSVVGLRLPPGAVSLPPDLDHLWGWTGPSQEWRNLAMSPRFDVTAALAARMWETKTGHHLDGVIATDPFALQAMLRATGPVTVDGQQISADNVIQDLLVEQYRGLGATGWQQIPTDNEARRERLSRINQAVFERVQAGHWDTATMITGLRDAVAGHHLLAWSSDGVEQRGWRAAGVTGELTDSSLALSLLNQGGTKVDQFLDVSARLDRRPHDGPTDEVTITVDVTNRTPNGLPSYVSGPSTGSSPGAGVPEGVYAGIISLNVPGSASELRVGDGSSTLVSGHDGPTVMVAQRLRLERGQSQTIVFTFRVAKNRGFSVSSSGRWPSVHWRTHDLEWWDDTGTKDVPATDAVG